MICVAMMGKSQRRVVAQVYLYSACRRTAWDELPEEWQQLFETKLKELKRPDAQGTRGFWKDWPRNERTNWKGKPKRASRV